MTAGRKDPIIAAEQYGPSSPGKGDWVNKEGGLSHLEKEWQAFLKSFEGLPESALIQPGVVGQWSIRDVMAHVTTWEEEGLKALPLILENKRLPRYGGIDAFNSREHERKRGLSLTQVKRELATTHKRLLVFLRDCPDDVFLSRHRFLRRLKWDTYHHYREHTEQITVWRAAR